MVGVDRLGMGLLEGVILATNGASGEEVVVSGGLGLVGSLRDQNLLVLLVIHMYVMALSFVRVT